MKWTPEEIRMLMVLCVSNATSATIASKLGRSAGAVRDKAGLLGLRRRTA